MKRLKRITALITVAMFLLSLAAPVLAAETTTAAAKVVIGADVVGTKYEQPSKKLIALDIIRGFEDGSIKPESNVTRAQFAVIVSKELGLGDLSPSATKFKDVAASHWASGAINLAVGKGIIVGYPDGTFKPEQPVSFAEASAMLMQMLGYAPALKGGSWPSTPLSLAATTGVSKGVRLASDDKTPRGDVLVMAANSLEVGIMEQAEWGTDTTYVKRTDDKTILTEVFDIDVRNKTYNDTKTPWDDRMPTVTKTARFDLGGLDSNEINFTVAGGGLAGDYEVNSNFDANQFMGQEVEAWVNEDDLMVYYIGPSNEETVYNDTVDSWPTGQISLDVRDDEYDLVDAASATAEKPETKVYINTATTDWEAIKGDATLLADLVDADVKVILADNNTDVKAMVITDYYSNDPAYETKSGFVKDVNATDETLNYIDMGGDETTLDLSDYDYAVVKNGIQASVSDLKADDVLNLLQTTDEMYVIATSKQVKGSVERVITSDTADIASYDVTVGGTKYDVTTECTFSDDNNENIDIVSASDLDDLTGDVTLYLDAQSNIKHIVSGVATESSSLYGVLTKTPQAGSYDEVKATLVTKQGQKISVTFDPGDVDMYDDANLGFPWTGSDISKTDWVNQLPVTQGNPIFFKYNVDSAGNLSEIHTVVTSPMGSQKIDAVNDKSINLGSGSFNITDKTVIWDATSWDGSEIDDMTTVSWSALDDRTVTGFAKTSGANVEYLVIATSDKGLGSGDNYGIVKGFGKKNGDDAITILGKDNVEVTYVWDGASMTTVNDFVYDTDRSTKAKIKKGDVVFFTLTGTGDAEEVDEIAVVAVPNEYTTPSGAQTDIQVDSMKLVQVTTSSSAYIKGKAITINVVTGVITVAATDTYYTVNSDTKYFDIHDTGNLKLTGSVSSGDTVVLIDTDDDSASADYVVKVID